MAQIRKESANELPSLSSVPRGLIVTRVSTDDPEVGSLAQKSRPPWGTLRQAVTRRYQTAHVADSQRPEKPDLHSRRSQDPDLQPFSTTARRAR